jgi:hypothetical protein
MILVIIMSAAYLGLACYHTLSEIGKTSKGRFYLHLIASLFALAILVGGALAYVLEHKL